MRRVVVGECEGHEAHPARQPRAHLPANIHAVAVRQPHVKHERAEQQRLYLTLIRLLGDADAIVTMGSAHAEITGLATGPGRQSSSRSRSTVGGLPLPAVRRADLALRARRSSLAGRAE
ncbi:hypothetical protein ACIBI9_33495 [Nonomuraea sp. NPDC050451]|uniref:hypothetical protein n=1 Tax=Nonomuraea sp. NPDC050451 TaxID=3364364 RepID=UPI0037AD5F70